MIRKLIIDRTKSRDKCKITIVRYREPGIIVHSTVATWSLERVLATPVLSFAIAGSRAVDATHVVVPNI
jgi:hypothetical protein